MSEIPIFEKLGQSVDEQILRTDRIVAEADAKYEFVDVFNARAKQMQGLFGRILFEVGESGELIEEEIHPSSGYVYNVYSNKNAEQRASFEFGLGKLSHEHTPTLVLPETDEQLVLKSVALHRYRPIKTWRETDMEKAIEIADIRSAIYVAELTASKNGATATQLTDLMYGKWGYYRFEGSHPTETPVNMRENVLTQMDSVNVFLGLIATSPTEAVLET